jgi:glutathione synthase/RimK-type ligase-like ATP-grasp enzyme
VTDSSDIDTLLVTRAQWRAWLSTLHTTETPWINDIWPARRAENKIEQLRVARRLGFTVPRTLVTNSPSEARAFAQVQPAVVKSLSSGYFEFSGHAFVYTHELTDDILSQEADWLKQPVIVQQRISGLDVRVVVVGDECFGARCSSGVLDWRTASRTAQWEPCAVSPALTRLCRSYLREFGLHYCAFDFVAFDGDYWFLEANQAGEWSFLERSLNLGIADCLVLYLLRLAGTASRLRAHSPT